MGIEKLKELMNTIMEKFHENTYPGTVEDTVENLPIVATFGCDPDEKVLGFSHIYNPGTGLIDVIGSDGKVVAEYIIC